MRKEELKIEYSTYTPRRISFACIVLCAILFAVLGVLPKISPSVTQVFRPIFIFFGFFAVVKGFYPLRSVKWQIVIIVYFTIILFSNPITGTAVTTYISMALFGAFYIIAVSIPWNKKEIALIFFVVVLACDIQALLVLYSNPHLLTAGGNQHISFLGVELNRNPVAFAITPGVLSSLLMFMYGKGSRLRTVFSGGSFLLCAFLVFALGCRSAFLSAVAGTILIMWQKTREGINAKDRFRRRVMLLVLVIIVFFAAFNLAAGNYSERLFDLEDDSGRQAIWDEAWKLIDAKPLFGGGFDYWESTGHQMGTHNTFLTFMVSGGWTAGILLGILYFALITEVLKGKNLMTLAFLVEALAHTWTEPGMDYYAYIPMIMSLVLVRYLKKHDHNITSIFG